MAGECSHTVGQGETGEEDLSSLRFHRKLVLCSSVYACDDHWVNCATIEGKVMACRGERLHCSSQLGSGTWFVQFSCDTMEPF